VIGELRPGRSTADAAAHFARPASSGTTTRLSCSLSSTPTESDWSTWARGSFALQYPIINRQWSLKYPQEIEEGMVIAVEGIEGKHREGGVRTESMCVVTANGPEIIDHFRVTRSSWPALSDVTVGVMRRHAGVLGRVPHSRRDVLLAAMLNQQCMFEVCHRRRGCADMPAP